MNNESNTVSELISFQQPNKVIDFFLGNERWLIDDFKTKLIRLLDAKPIIKIDAGPVQTEKFTYYYGNINIQVLNELEFDIPFGRDEIKFYWQIWKRGGCQPYAEFGNLLNQYCYFEDRAAAIIPKNVFYRGITETTCAASLVIPSHPHSYTHDYILCNDNKTIMSDIEIFEWLRTQIDKVPVDDEFWVEALSNIDIQACNSVGLHGCLAGKAARSKLKFST